MLRIKNQNSKIYKNVHIESLIFPHVSEEILALLYYFLLHLNTLIIVQKCTLIIVQTTNNSTSTLIIVQNCSDIYKIV